MTPKSTITLHLFLTLTVFLLIRFIISYMVLSSYGIIVVDAEFDRDNSIEIFYSAGNKFLPNQVIRSQPFLAGKRTVHQIPLNNNVARSLRIDLGNTEGICKIYSLRLVSFFGDSIVLDPESIHKKFKPNDNIESYVLQDEHLLISSNGNDPFMVSTETFRVNNFFLLHIFPFIPTFLFWIVVSSFSFRSFPLVQDLNNKKSSLGVQIGSIDGIRGIAALMVLAEHTGVLKGIGALGVWLFFALSGFLLVTPFVHDPTKACSFSYMQSFLLRRLKRIVPMYYTFILITMFFNMRYPVTFRHLLFLQGDGHLWTIPQEMFFYLLLPFIMLLCCIPIPKQKIYCFALLTGMIWCSNTYLTTDVISLYGYGRYLRPFIGIFLSGVLFSYINYWVNTSGRLNRLDIPVKKYCSSILGILLLLVLILLFSETIQEITHFDIERHFGLIGFLSAAFIFLVVTSEDALLGRIMSFLPLRAVGLVGFSFYLLHPTLIGFCRTLAQHYFYVRLPDTVLFIVSGIATYLLSMLTYTYIERPFLYNKNK